MNDLTEIRWNVFRSITCKSIDKSDMLVHVTTCIIGFSLCLLMIIPHYFMASFKESLYYYI